MAYLTESVPQRGVATEMAPGIRRIVAENPGAMTYHGTNTYLLEGPEGVSVLDPGPLDAAHLAALLAHMGKVARILVSHTHHDHVAGLPALRAATGAPVFAFSPDVAPDHLLADGDVVAGWQALHTPGHAPDHVCFARADGVVLTADHVMGWSSSVVLPPEGNMAAYFASLERLLGRGDRLYLPGHGPAIPQPEAHTRFLLDHRIGRENAILAALDEGAREVAALVESIYVDLAAHLRPMAARNVTAHLHKLHGEGRAVRAGEAWATPDSTRDRASSG